MSVVIRMEMPENCIKCPIYTACEFAGNMAEDNPYECRSGKCPIVCELPKNHGRLVDADALCEKMKERDLKYQDEETLFDKVSVITSLNMFSPTVVESEVETEDEMEVRDWVYKRIKI